MTECVNCESEYDIEGCDESVCCDIVEGQYVEFYTYQCPNCGCYNR